MRERQCPCPASSRLPQTCQEFTRAPVWIEDAARSRVTQAIQPFPEHRSTGLDELPGENVDQERLCLLLAQSLTGLLTLVNAVAFLLILGPQSDDRVVAAALLVALLPPILLLRRLSLLLSHLLDRGVASLRARACRSKPHPFGTRFPGDTVPPSRRWQEGETRRSGEIFPFYEYPPDRF